MWRLFFASPSPCPGSTAAGSGGQSNVTRALVFCLWTPCPDLCRPSPRQRARPPRDRPNHSAIPVESSATLLPRSEGPAPARRPPSRWEKAAEHSATAPDEGPQLSGYYPLSGFPGPVIRLPAPISGRRRALSGVIRRGRGVIRLRGGPGRAGQGTEWREWGAVFSDHSSCYGRSYLQCGVCWPRKSSATPGPWFARAGQMNPTSSTSALLLLPDCACSRGRISVCHHVVTEWAPARGERNDGRATAGERAQSGPAQTPAIPTSVFCSLGYE
ncbi:hypothetical protein DFJ74DRAFT_27627 [Hyaloraphidium curvatum]|nr:hypothetical protein DFJ74DRAFT_27627 [Hyaloraphidium curvatum]